MATLQQSGHAPVNGLQMYYEIYGEGGTPLVLIHGGGSTIQVSFGQFLPLLTGKVIAVELQAHGRTSDRDAPESFAQDADDVAALLQYLQVEKADILGFSNGGSTALQLAIRHPQQVHKIVAVAAASKRDGFIPGFFGGLEAATLADMPAFLQAAFLQVNPSQEGLRNMFEKDRQRMVTFTDWPDAQLQSIQAPVLLLIADQDVITVTHNLDMQKLIPGARLAVLPGFHGAILGETGSLPAGSRLPQTTAALVQEFLQA